MPVVVAEQSISLDGFSAGANQSPANPMGDGGQRLHEWLSATSSQPDANVIDAYWSRIGAV
ncbi:MAG: dihydrofolate reductase, partial [Chloroflexia bacterium]|nr:dihydrofolate reductase [Chloroflexia bacterium]